VRAALLDLDGTLVDANYHHALAWYRAFRRFEIILPVWRLHRHIGMGGDQYVAAVAGDGVESERGDDLRDAHDDEFSKIRDECAGLAGAKDLLVELKQRGWKVVLASSANGDDTQHFIDLLDAGAWIDDYTTADDVDRTKPHPDVVHTAMEKAGADDGVMVGDSRWDIDAARNAGLATVSVITGGWSEQELRDAGAVAVYDSLPDLIGDIDSTPLA
jgi:HAD superfamily hydrolase (TIGR01549 family)